MRARHGGLVTMVLGGERVVLVSDPAAAQQVVVDDADVWVKEGTAFFPNSALAGNGLLVSDGDTWRRQRRMTNPAFRRTAVRRLM
jgi:cytochrome P450